MSAPRPDGSGLRALTHPGPGDFDINAVVSPDGSRVLFERDLPDGRSVLVMVGADRQGAHTIPVSCADPRPRRPRLGPLCRDQPSPARPH